MDGEERLPLVPATSEGVGPSGDSQASSSGADPEAPQQPGVCRICLEEDSPANLDAPCSCSGTMKFAHFRCLQRWIDEKGDRVCEICKQPFSGDYEEPPTPPPRPQHVTVWGQEYLIVADPETGTIRAHRLQGLYDDEEEEVQEDRVSTGAAWCFTAILLLICLLLLRHLFSLFASSAVPPPGGGQDGSGGEGSGSGKDAPHHSQDEPGGRGSEGADSAFEDLSMTLLVLWLLVRMLVMVAPCYAVWGGAAAWARSRAGFARGQQQQQQRGVDAGEVELERRLDQLIQRMEAGAAPTDPPAPEAPHAAAAAPAQASAAAEEGQASQAPVVQPSSLEEQVASSLPRVQS